MSLSWVGPQKGRVRNVQFCGGISDLSFWRSAVEFPAHGILKPAVLGRVLRRNFRPHGALRGLRRVNICMVLGCPDGAWPYTSTKIQRWEESSTLTNKDCGQKIIGKLTNGVCRGHAGGVKYLKRVKWAEEVKEEVNALAALSSMTRRCTCISSWVRPLCRYFLSVGRTESRSGGIQSSTSQDGGMKTHNGQTHCIRLTCGMK